ncbi:TRAP transporter small permease [Vibrio sp.]|uniref:TRAP transporter small permease protein n=1 Tax=Vibrio viridaestus TaxID=2487322 RepID=A0A3N9TJL5_9VIBR|nr:TRAP transporter small permease [Vibrio viridaestus]MDC0610627.1 TRAP transporter small permease [Vibrio sp.]RQW63755.1 TRAP transporter small permease [Vibrio viridaestus]
MIQSILKGYCHLIRFIVSLIGKSVSYLLPVLAGIVCFEVFARYVLERPTIWGYDTSLFIFGYIAALGGAYAQQKEAHINVDIVYAKVSEKTKRIFDLITCALAIFFLWVMAHTCWDMFMQALKYGYKTKSEWAPPMHHFWLMITVSAAIFIAQYTTDFICNVYYLLTGKELLEEPHQVSELSDQPFKLDSQQLEKPAFDKESPNGN